jgi:peptidyl-dipeptidase Dcp
MKTGNTETCQERTNPFLAPFNTPRNTIPFDKIKLEDIKSAILKGMEIEDRETEDITNNPDTPTFENTIIPYIYTGKVADSALTTMSNLLSACTSDGLEKLAQELSPLITEHALRISHNKKLFDRIKSVKNSKPSLDHESQTLLDKTYEGFVKSGINFPKKKKERLEQIAKEMSVTTLQFSQNVLKDTNRFQLHITDKSELEGLPEMQMEQAADLAKEKGLEGWCFTLDAPSYRPIMTYCKNRALRRKMFLAYNTLCIKKNKYNNLELVRKIVNLRLESAKLHGFKTYAQMVLKHRMARNTQTVDKFIDRLLKAYKPTALADYENVKAYARKAEGPSFKFKAWDVSYYSHKLQLETYNIDSEMMRPYFQLDKVIEGVFGLATKLYGITFKRNDTIPVYHEDVIPYEVFDEDGSYLAVLYADFHPRPNKKSGAWMTTFQEQWIDKDGNDIRPHISLCMNLTKPTETKPALLTQGEVATFMHEFGHGLHEMFSKCKYQPLSGTNVYWDFVELPSQFMENYANSAEFLKTFARHYQTGEPIPDELIDRAKKASHFNVGWNCLRQLSFCMLDMAYHTRTEPLDADIIEFEKAAWEPAIIGDTNSYHTCMTTQFNHIMAGGYAAGYYSYKWAEVLDADAFAAFKETGIFNKETAARFRHEILEKGNTEHPAVLYKNFRHRNPSIKAMLKRDGITSAK